MKIINPTYAILDPDPIDGPKILRQIEQAARTCYKSENRITKGSAEKLIEALIKRGHHAMLEFGPSITVNFVCNRGFTHELVRHRIASFAQESTRYCNYYNRDGGITVISPIYFKGEHVAYTRWEHAMRKAEKAYLFLISIGRSPQEARGVLPIDLKTEINIKANIREWRHILKLRTSTAAHPQMRQLMCPLLTEFKTKIPILFNDL